METRHRSIVKIINRLSGQPVGLATILDESHLVTCAHVVAAAAKSSGTAFDDPVNSVVQLRLTFLPGEPIRQARVVRYSEELDFAGLRIQGEALPRVAMGAPVEMSVQDESVQLFGYPSDVSRPNGTWTNATIVGQVGTGLIQLDSATSSAVRAQPGYSGTAVWSRDRQTMVGMLVTASQREDRLDAYAIPIADICAEWPEVLGDLLPNPYRGLQAFNEEDADLFYGRTLESSELQLLVDRSPLAVVLGPSGVGKSSLVFAGLLPALRLQFPQLSVIRFKPGIQPFNALASALLASASIGAPQPGDVNDLALRIRSDGLESVLTTLPGRTSNRTILVVDQLEEVYSPEIEHSAASAFVETLLQFADSLESIARGDNNLSLVCTIRADFYAASLLQHEAAGRRLNGRTLQLSPLGRLELAEAVEAPAEKFNVRYAEHLTSRIVDDVLRNKGSLPLLQFTLRELWPRQRGRRISHESYLDLGQVAGSITKKAEDLTARLISVGVSEDELAATLMRLISNPGTDLPLTRRIGRFAELSVRQKQIISALVNARLVTSDQSDSKKGGIGPEATFEIAHEQLITHWTRMNILAQNESDFVRWRSRMESWIREQNGLLPADWVAEARNYTQERPRDVPDSVRVVIEQSYRRDREQVDVLDAVQSARDRALAMQRAAHAELLSREPDRLVEALTIAKESIAGQWTPQGDAIVRDLLGVLDMRDRRLSVVDSISFVGIVHPRTGRLIGPLGAEHMIVIHEGPIADMSISPDGSQLATITSDGTARLFDLPTPRSGMKFQGSLVETVLLNVPEWMMALHESSRTPRSGSFELSLESNRSWIQFEAGGDRVVALRGVDSLLSLYSERDGHSDLAGDAWHGSKVEHFTTAANGTIACGNRDWRVVIGNVDRSDSAQIIAHGCHLSFIKLAANGEFLATGTFDGQLTLFTEKANRWVLHAVAETSGRVTAIAFDANDRALVSGSSSGSVKVSSIDGVHLWQNSAEDEVVDLCWDQELSLIAVLYSTGQVMAYEAESGELRWTAQTAEFSAQFLAHDTRTSLIAVASMGFMVSVLSLLTGELVHRLRHAERVTCADFTPDGRFLITGGLDRAVRIHYLAVDDLLLRANNVLSQEAYPLIDHPLWRIDDYLTGRVELVGDTGIDEWGND